MKTSKLPRLPKLGKLPVPVMIFVDKDDHQVIDFPPSLRPQRQPRVNTIPSKDIESIMLISPYGLTIGASAGVTNKTLYLPLQLQKRLFTVRLDVPIDGNIHHLDYQIWAEHPRGAYGLAKDWMKSEKKRRGNPLPAKSKISWVRQSVMLGGK